MKLYIIVLFSLLPFAAMAQTDTLYMKSGAKIPVSITRVEEGKVYYNTGSREAFSPESNLSKYYWKDKPVVPNKKDDLIFIETSDSPDEAFIKIGRLIASNGIPIINSDKELGIVSTGIKPIHGTLSISMNATIESTTKTIIKISGLYDGMDISLYGMSSEQKFPIYYVNSGFPNMRRAWAEIDNIAKAYPGGKISYGKR